MVTMGKYGTEEDAEMDVAEAEAPATASPVHPSNEAAGAAPSAARVAGGIAAAESAVPRSSYAT